MSDIQAVIFDCFGVLVSEQWLSFKHRYFGHDTQQSQEAADLMQQADAGYISHDEFIAKVAELSGQDEATVNRYLDRNTANEDLFDYIRDELKPHYKIGMLSNAAADWLDELFEPDQLQLFDAISLSFNSGVAKPEAGAYEAIADKLGLSPEQCVFVDDQERHCTGASEAGMRSILYKDLHQLKADLEKLLAK